MINCRVIFKPRQCVFGHGYDDVQKGMNGLRVNADALHPHWGWLARVACYAAQARLCEAYDAPAYAFDIHQSFTFFYHSLKAGMIFDKKHVLSVQTVRIIDRLAIKFKVCLDFLSITL